MANEAQKGKALELALAQIEKAYGREAIMMLGDRAKKINIEVIPTGILSLDLALGVGGFPRGRTTSARPTTKTTPNGCSRNSRSGASTRRLKLLPCFSPRRMSESLS